MKLNLRFAILVLIVFTTAYLTLQVVEISHQYSDQTEHYHTVQYVNGAHKSHPEPLSVARDARIFQDGRAAHHIAFLKVHKAASGTATSIFFRYGMKNDLTFVLPKYLNILSSSDTITEKQIHPRLNKSFDIMTSHVIYNRKAFESFVNADTVYIGILREPYQQFKSSMNYMAPKYVYNISKDDPIQQYLKNPQKYEPKAGPRFSWINNRQAVEFGAPDELILKKNVTEIDKFVAKLDKEFHLVLIAEYFDESVVLMKRMLNWKLTDILYRRLHTRGWDRKLTLPRPYDRQLFRKHASVDYALYDFFFSRLWAQAKHAGEDFFDEVLWFKKVRDEVDDYCKVYPNMTEPYLVPRSTWSDNLAIDKQFCEMMYAEEEDWVVQIAKKQYNITKKSLKQR